MTQRFPETALGCHSERSEESRSSRSLTYFAPSAPKIPPTRRCEFRTGYRRSLQNENTTLRSIGLRPMKNEPESPFPAGYRSSYHKSRAAPRMDWKPMPPKPLRVSAPPREPACFLSRTPKKSRDTRE